MTDGLSLLQIISNGTFFLYGSKTISFDSENDYRFAGWATSSAGDMIFDDKGTYTMETEGATL